MAAQQDRKDIEELVQLVCNVMEAYTVAFLRYDAAADELRMFSWFSLGSTVNGDAAVKPGQGMIGWVVKERKPLAVKEFSHDPTTLKLYLAKEEIKSFMAVPVMDGDRFLGVLTVDSKRQYLFTTKHQKLTSDFALALAKAVLRHERVDQLRHEAACIETIAEVVTQMGASERLSHIVKVLYANVGKLVDHSMFIFALKSSEEGIFNVIPEPSGDDEEIRKLPLVLDQSLMGWVIRKNQPLNHHDLGEHLHGLNMGFAAGEGYRSFLGVPMVVRRQVIGALGVLAVRERAFTAADMRILSILGSIAASYVAGAYAYGIGLISRKVDSLTGLGNYVYLEEKLAETPAVPGALLTLDLCRFHRITLDFSVELADSALVEIGRFLKRIIGAEGFVTRYYGDVFHVFLMGHDRQEAGLAGRKLLDLLKAKNFFIDDKHILFEGRMGIALLPGDARNPDDLIKRSFSALQEARKGKGTMVFYDELGKNPVL